MAWEKVEQESLIKEVRKKPQKKLNRWALAVLFLLTILASAGFYLKTEIPKYWEKINSPTIISTVPKELKFDPSPVLEEIGNLTKDLWGTYGVYVYQLTDGNKYGVNEKEIFPAASLMKLPLIAGLYQEAEAGKISLETEYQLVEKDKVLGAGILQSKNAGTVYTYRQLIQYMGQYSDNTAYTVMLRVLGKEQMQKTIDDLGMESTSLQNHETTPADIGLFFRKLYKGEVVSSEDKDEILKFLTKTGYEDRIPAGLPTGTRVAHKIGTDIGTFSDAGIVFAKKPFVLVIMSKEAKESEAKEVLPKITEKVWEFENK